MAEWDSAYITDLPDSAFACIDSSGRHYPHHNAAGNLDLPHLRNALSRVAQEDTTSCGVLHLRDHAEEEAVGETKSMAVKFVAPDTIEGLAFPFDSYDTDTETFTKSTDYCEDWFPGGRPLLYEHGLDRSHQAVKIGRQTEFEDRDGGRWAQSQIDMHAKYRKHIDQLIERGMLGYSSGSLTHLAQKNSQGELTRWPWVELSLTPIPAHPATLGVHYIKSAKFLDLIEDDVPPAVKAALEALDQWASDSEDDGLPAGLKFADHGDRLLADVEEFRDRVSGLVTVRAKSGRVLSAQTRQRLGRHPASLRELADDIDALLSETDAEKVAKAIDPAILHDAAAALVRAALVDMPE